MLVRGTHLLFVDDSILFEDATMYCARVLKGFLT